MAVPTTILPTPDELGAALAEHVAARMRDRPRQAFLVGWPAGRTPKVLVDGLCVLARRGLDLSAVVLVGMDEFLTRGTGGWRTVDPSVHYSCRGWTLRRVLEPLQQAAGAQRGVPPDHLWTPTPDDPEAYEEAILRAGGIDLFIVASGSGDGHIALNSPPADLWSRTRVVELPDSTRRDNLATFPDLPSLEAAPTHGVTVGIATIADADEVALLLPGHDKQQAARRLFDLDAFDPMWPASFVHDHPRATCWVDRLALGTTTDSFATPAAKTRVTILEEKA